MNIPNKQKIDKRNPPVARHREKIGEFHNKVQAKIERKEPSKMSDIELGEGTRVIQILGIIILLCLLFLGFSLIS